jgi:hypothetical protein
MFPGALPIFLGSDNRKSDCEKRVHQEQLCKGKAKGERESTAFPQWWECPIYAVIVKKATGRRGHVESNHAKGQRRGKGGLRRFLSGSRDQVGDRSDI